MTYVLDVSDSALGVLRNKSLVSFLHLNEFCNINIYALYLIDVKTCVGEEGGQSRSDGSQHHHPVKTSIWYEKTNFIVTTITSNLD